MIGGYRCCIMLIDEVPNQNQTVVTSRGKNTTSIRGPFHAVQRGGVTLEFQESLARLPHIEDSNDTRI